MASATNAKACNAYYKCKSNGVIYNDPNESSKKTGVVKKGETYRVDEIYKNGWFRIYKLKSGATDKNAKPSDHVKVGWVSPSKMSFQKNITPIVDTLSYPLSTAVTDTVKKNMGIALNTNRTASVYTTGSELPKLKKGESESSTVYQQNDITNVFTRSNFITSSIVNNNDYMNAFIKTIENYGLIVGPQDAQYKYHNQFNRTNFLDPYNVTLNGAKEYLFFVKPDLNIVRVSQGNEGNLVSFLAVDSFFVDLVKNHPDTVKALQFSYDRLPFSTLLSATCRSSLDIPNIDAETMDGPANIYGTSIEYRQGGGKSDENLNFSLEFRETKNLDVYYFFKAYEMYEQKKMLGLLKPKYQNYISYKILYDQMGIYKFMIAEDMHTILHYSYLCGVKPMSVPRSAFSSPDPQKVLDYTIDFKAEFIEDMNPAILRDFNILMGLHRSAYGAKHTVIEDFDHNTVTTNGEWAYGAEVKVAKVNGKDRFVMEWYKQDS